MGVGDVGWSARARKRRASVVAAGGVAADHQDGVVAGDGAEDLGELGLVEGGGEELRGTGRGAQHDQVGAGLGADQELGAEPGEPGLAGGGLARRRGSSVAALGRDGVDEGAGGGADLDRVELEPGRARASPG